MQTTIKEDKHFQHYRDELASDVQQKANESIHISNKHMLQLLNYSNFTTNNTKETLKTSNMNLNTMRPETGYAKTTQPSPITNCNTGTLETFCE